MSTVTAFDFGSFGARGSWNWDLLEDGKIHVLVRDTGDYTGKYPDAVVRVHAKQKQLKVLVRKRLKTGDETGDLKAALAKCKIGGEYMVVQFPKTVDTAKKSNRKPKTTAVSVPVETETQSA